jgi:hypothetical protein
VIDRRLFDKVVCLFVGSFLIIIRCFFLWGFFVWVGFRVGGIGAGCLFIKIKVCLANILYLLL